MAAGMQARYPPGDAANRAIILARFGGRDKRLGNVLKFTATATPGGVGANEPLHRFDLLEKIAEHAPKSERRELRALASVSLPVETEIEVVKRARRFRDAVFLFGDSYVFLVDDHASYSMFGSFVVDRDLGLRCNEIIGPSFELNDKSLRRLFTWLEMLMRLTLSIQSGREVTMNALASKKGRAHFKQACDYLGCPKVEAGLHRLFDVRVYFGHTPIEAERLPFNGIPLRDSFSQARLEDSEAGGGMVSFVDEAFAVTGKLIEGYRRIQHRALDLKKLRSAVAGVD
jgi:hypothetical protein